MNRMIPSAFKTRLILTISLCLLAAACRNPAGGGPDTPVTPDWPNTPNRPYIPRPLRTGTDIETFSFDNLVPPATVTIDPATHTVTVTVPLGTDLANLTPTIGLSAGATVRPLSGVPQDFTSTVTYTVTAEDGTTTAVWTVEVKELVTDLSGLEDYLTKIVTDDPTVGTQANPIPLPVGVDLADSANGWAALLTAINDANSGTGTYVTLDLSACTMSSGTEFNPGTANTGVDKIVSLVLPP
jgi:hypothetical protein